MTREELIDELSDAIDDRMDMDVSYSMLADACVTRLVELGLIKFELTAEEQSHIMNSLTPKGE